MTENKAICTQESMDSLDIRRIRLSHEKRSEHGVTDSAHVFFFCHEMCVKANESVQHNGVLQCGRPHPFLKVASGPLKRTSGDLKRKG